MKVEKISDTQLKFFLDEDDLNNKYVNIKELMSEKINEKSKAIALINEMLSEVSEEYDFEIENTSFMIEAVSISPNKLIIILSKVQSDMDYNKGFDMTPKSKTNRKFKKSTVLEDNADVMGENGTNEFLIYSFKTFEELSDACSKISDEFNTLESKLYKYENLYYLLIRTSKNAKSDRLMMLLSEYGQKHMSNEISVFHLIEHSEVIIKNDALKIIKLYI